jgi:hypothetical protein
VIALLTQYTYLKTIDRYHTWGSRKHFGYVNLFICISFVEVTRHESVRLKNYEMRTFKPINNLALSTKYTTRQSLFNQTSHTFKTNREPHIYVQLHVCITVHIELDRRVHNSWKLTNIFKSSQKIRGTKTQAHHPTGICKRHSTSATYSSQVPRTTWTL